MGASQSVPKQCNTNMTMAAAASAASQQKNHHWKLVAPVAFHFQKKAPRGPTGLLVAGTDCKNVRASAVTNERDSMVRKKSLGCDTESSAKINQWSHAVEKSANLLT